jgi:uncharacterized membrane protein HdeD (DUF308 family)
LCISILDIPPFWERLLFEINFRSFMEIQFNKIESIRNNWGWFLALGILLILLGGAVIASSYYATIFSVIIFGLFLLVAGVVQIFQAFLARKWGGLFLSLFLGILYIVTGALCIVRPETAAISITLWIAAFCFVVGLFKMLAALIVRFNQWGWVFFNGLVTFLLGIMIYSDWPLSGLWVIGLFIGVDLILAGWSWVILSLTAKSEPKIW